MSGFNFGAPASASATGLFGAPAASAPAGGLFGVKPAAPAGGLFGAVSSAAPPTGGLFGAPASTTGGLFGAASTAPAAGGLFGATPASTGGLFGATTSAAPTGGMFGAPASAPGGVFGSTPATTGGFGTSAFGAKPVGTTGFSFGGTPAPTTGSLFGGAPKPFGSSLAPAFGASTASSVPTFGASLSTNSRQQYVTGNIKPEISAWQKFLYFKNAWDPTHPNCQFKFYFYNFVHPDDVSKYGPPPNTDPHEWMQAMQESPDRECMVPALAVGFEDLKKRMESQNDMTEMQRIKLDEVEAKMNDIMQFHLLQTASKVREFKRRHIQLAQRVLTLMKRVQILRNRGVPISQEEEKLRGRLEELLEQLKNPAHFRGKITELWAQIQILKDSKRLHPSGNYEVSDEAQLEVIGKVLTDQQAGLQHITSVLQKDMADIETLQRKLEEIGAAGRS
ncbi:hypothetical protein BGZ82_000585 [Podila clonocystis]|nr:hypothetical protein BGZ82_000585 [Podila clonocystis]